MALLQQILFILAAAMATGLFIKKIRQIRRNILLGGDDGSFVRDADSGRRWTRPPHTGSGKSRLPCRI